MGLLSSIADIGDTFGQTDAVYYYDGKIDH
jgi:hypothetical protein